MIITVRTTATALLIASAAAMLGAAPAHAATPRCALTAQPAHGVRSCGGGGATTSAPAVVSQPLSESTPDGSTATFTASAIANPLATVLWLYSTDDGATWNAASSGTVTSPAPNVTASSYSIQVSANESGDLVEAVFANSVGLATTTPATLTVLPAAPVASVAPATLGFGNVMFGNASGLPVVLTNNGPSDLTISSASTEAKSVFQIVHDACSGASLPPGSSCEVDILFVPPGVGQLDDMLTLVDNSAAGSDDVPITGAGVSVPTILPSPLNPASVGEPYRDSILASGYPQPRIARISGSLPPGVHLNSGGVLAGTPTTPGTYSFTVRASNGIGTRATRLESIVVGPAPTISIVDAAMLEGRSGYHTLSFTVSLSRPSTVGVTARFATSDLTAIAGSDYVAKTGKVSFAAGSTTTHVNVSVNGDGQVEPDEKFQVTLSSPTRATLGRPSGIGTIVNDD